jgi:FkbM family methyltransferase
MGFLVTFLGRLPRSWLKTGSRLQWRHPFFKWLFELAAGQIRWREGAIQQGIGRGLRFNPGGANAGYVLGTYEPLMQQAFLRILQPGMCVYDVGANVGYLTILAAKLVGPKGQIVAFEPLAANARQIQHNAELNSFTHVRVRQEALGDKEGQAAFRVSAESGWGKLAYVGAVSQETAIIEVPVRKLDSITAGGELPRVHLMKIDVEGAEVDVLRGAIETLRAERPFLLVELHGTNCQVADLLLELDYEMGVLGSSASIRGSPWYAQVFAWPSERCEAAGLAGLRSAAH